jgi:hypothetical protein
MNTHQRNGVDRRSFLASAGIAAGVTTLAGMAAASAQSSNDLDALSRRMTETERTTIEQFRNLLRIAADVERVSLNLNQTVVASKYNHLVVAAPALGIEKIDPIELRSGITQGLIYTKSAPSKLSGFYVVRAVALQDIRLGEQPVLVQMIQRGVVVAEERGVAHIWSLTVPPTVRGQAQVGLAFDIVMHDQVTRADCWTCPNGVTICVERPLCGVDGLLPSGSPGCP